MDKKQKKELMRLCQLLPQVKHDLFASGLYETGQAIDVAVRKIGFEVAALIERSDGIAAKDEAIRKASFQKIV